MERRVRRVEERVGGVVLRAGSGGALIRGRAVTLLDAAGVERWRALGVRVVADVSELTDDELDAIVSSDGPDLSRATDAELEAIIGPA